jgi:hypothetical protein
LGPVKYANRNVAAIGLTMAARLLRLARAPCTLPCSASLTEREISPCSAGPAMPPRLPITMTGSIIQPAGTSA